MGYTRQWHIQVVRFVPPLNGMGGDTCGLTVMDSHGFQGGSKYIQIANGLNVFESTTSAHVLPGSSWGVSPRLSSWLPTLMNSACMGFLLTNLSECQVGGGSSKAHHFRMGLPYPLQEEWGSKLEKMEVNRSEMDRRSIHILMNELVMQPLIYKLLSSSIGSKKKRSEWLLQLRHLWVLLPRRS